MNDRFQTLSTLATLFMVVGWLIVISSIFTLIASVAALGESGYHKSIFRPPSDLSMIPAQLTLVLSVIGIVLGLFMVILGEAIGVVFAIEANTRKCANLLTEVKQSAMDSAAALAIIKSLPEKPARGVAPPREAPPPSTGEACGTFQPVPAQGFSLRPSKTTIDPLKCSSCGAKLEGGEKFCETCGKPV